MGRWLFVLLALVTGLVLPSGVEQGCLSARAAEECEASVEKNAPGLFVRRGHQLIVHLANGKSRTYRDVVPDEQHESQIILYRFVRHYPEVGYGLIAADYYEGGGHYLLNLRTGAQVGTTGNPILSPDRVRFAVANADVELHYRPNELKVYRIEPARLVVEFDAKPKDWGAEELKWRTNDELFFTETRFDSKSLSAIDVSQRSLRRRSGRWAIE